MEYEYEALHDDELTLQLGDIIKNVRYIEEDGWMEGELNGKRGLFPDNFVKVRTKSNSFSVFEYYSFVTSLTSRADCALPFEVSNAFVCYCSIRDNGIEAMNNIKPKQCAAKIVGQVVALWSLICPRHTHIL